MPETALIIEVPESEFLVGKIRSKFDKTASNGVPAHITVLYPFIGESQLSESVLRELRDLASMTRQYSFQLTHWCRFETALWLCPDPAEPFRKLTLEIWRRFPSCPPYGGKHSEVQPHLTAAQFDAEDRLDSQWDKIEAQTVSSLPIDCVARGISIYVSNDAGKWKKHSTLPFLD